MTEPRQPDDHPAPEDKKAPDPHRPTGVPKGAEDGEPKGYPHSDRHETETAPNKT